MSIRRGQDRIHTGESFQFLICYKIKENIKKLFGITYIYIYLELERLIWAILSIIYALEFTLFFNLV